MEVSSKIGYGSVFSVFLPADPVGPLVSSIRETFIVLWKWQSRSRYISIRGKSSCTITISLSYDINRSYRELAAKGATLSEIDEHTGIRFFETFDPDGNVFNIVETFENSPYYAHKMKYKR
ncbi:hypothetical protein [Cohnella luojiensis]|uniref:Uncharacterized protein n=1 Tax=Cohnella luojiensis TaxID=652876 RepID=A0A4Y8LRK2_9BACL|nr:hypothetical protein [Cohnella luojiensis]TFE23987.1 hypothetical protein E2980_17390 [Cohnella luojiensis]